jgi:hydroxymethylbilane synthase
VAELLDADVELVPITTSGDAGSDPPPSSHPSPQRGRRLTPGDKSRFVKEIEEALLRGDVDMAVHSAKDVPAELPEGLAIVGVPAREDPRDALCGAASLDDLAEGAVVGTSSLRRRAQLLARRPDLDVRELRGNVDTRLGRLADGDFGALVLARAGLVRLGRDEGEPIDAGLMVPAAGQGCLLLEARADDDDAIELGAAVTDPPALQALTAERTLVGALDATCHTPVGAHAAFGDDGLRLTAFVGLPDGSHWIEDSLAVEEGHPADLGAEVAERLLAAGAGDLLDRAEAAAGRE